MGDRDDLPYIVIERHDSGVAPFLWGALLGAAAALLLAPRSGAETQRQLRDRVVRLRSDAEDRVDGVRDAVREAVDRTRDRVAERIDAVREAVETRAAQARDAIETGRQAARDARSELETRLAQAKQAARGEERPQPTDRPVADVDIVVTDVVVEEPTRPDLG